MMLFIKKKSILVKAYFGCYSQCTMCVSLEMLRHNLFYCHVDSFVLLYCDLLFNSVV